MDRRTTIALALGTVSLGLLVYGTRRAHGRPSPRLSLTITTSPKVPPPSTVRGAVVCPGEIGVVPARLGLARPGDFVALRLANHSGTFTEIVWAVIETIHGKGSPAAKLPSSAPASTAMVVRLTGTIGSTIVSTPDAKMHGFSIGVRLVLETNCAWELFRSSSKGMALCGLYGQQVAGHPAPASAADAVAGQEVLVYLAPVEAGAAMTPGPGWDVPNPVWARIVHVSATKSVLRVLLLEQPAPMPSMTLGSGDRIDISRDCIFDVRPGGG